MNLPRICACLLLPIQLAQAVEIQVRPPDIPTSCEREKAVARTPRIPQNGIGQLPSLPAISAKPEVPPPVTPRPIQPSAPFPMPTCEQGGCWDSGGNRYNGGVGNTYLDKNGRPCHRSGEWMQCF